MKAILLIFTMLTISTHALAADVVAELIKTPGYEYNPTHITLQILNDGRVMQKVVKMRDQKQTRRQIATVNMDRITQLQTKIDSLTYEVLADNDPNSPGCVDAPAFTWVVYQTNSSDLFRIQQKAECKLFELPQGKYSAKPIIEVLQGLYTLGLM